MDASTAEGTTCPYTGAAPGSDRPEASPPEVGDVAVAARLPSDPKELPVADWVDVAQLRIDPYPTYARLRAESPVAWVPAIKKVLIASQSGCIFGEQHPEIFSNEVSGAHMTQTFGGKPMIRKDGDEHAAERNVINPTLRPKTIARVWEERFRANAEHYLDDLEAAGPGADLNTVFAAPLAASNLLDMLGFTGMVSPADLARWSADFMAGAGNVLDDPEVALRGEEARNEVIAAVNTIIPRLRENPDDSITSLLLHSGLPMESVYTNVMLTISGGVSEPQHIITSSVTLLTQHPEYVEWAMAEPGNFGAIFQETVRFQTPIAMVTRETRSETVVDGYRIPENSQVGMILASANRDSQVIENPDVFNPMRSERRHLGFGSGNHMCAGKWAAETAIGRIAVPALYTRFPTLRTDPGNPGRWDGWVFRGLRSLPVIW